uniref:EF-P 5-aminopentanol modification-associated protein YfmF n=1 Tax=uncultured Allobacillus sp. TaxID=1638025 RepID=UPI0025991ECB|nr:pitrilysin family protein [uncultured Allobacillus sp.]
MSQVTEQTIQKDDYSLHLIDTKKFKTNTIALKFTRPLKRENITERALLPFVLQKGSEKYPTERALRQQLDELYGAKFSIYGGKKGENHIVTFILDIPNEKFIKDEETLTKEGLQFLSEVLTKPRAKNQAFDETLVEKEKDTLKSKIQSIIDEKMQYANMRLIDEMCEDEAFGIHAHGYLDDLPQLDGKSLYETYHQMLTEDRLGVYVVGDFDNDQMEKDIEENLTFSRNPQASIFRSESILPKKVETITEKQKIQQAKLHMGFRTGVQFSDDNFPALQVFNGIFGGYPHSKLFLNVREKHSLAYYAASRIESNKGLLFVFSGIAPDKYDQAREIIEAQHQAINDGEITDKEIDQTKKAITNQLKETLDRSTGIIELFHQQVIGGKSEDPQAIAKAIQSVTKEDVIAVSKQIQLDTVYFLTAENGGEEA